MAQLETWIRQDLKKPLQVQYLSGTMFSQDNAANLVGVEVFDDGEPATLGGSVSANVVRSDGGTVAVSGGTLSGNKVSVILPQAAYAIPGAISIIIKLTTGGTVTTLGAIVVTVYRSSTDAVVDPGTIIPSVQTLIAQIETAVASIPADYSSLWTSLAPAFSDSTAYTAGQYVTYNGHLYRFTANHAAGSFVQTDCTQVDVGGELSALKSAFNEYGSLSVGYGVDICDQNMVTGTRGNNGKYGNPLGTTSVTTKNVIPVSPSTKYALSFPGISISAVSYYKYTSTSENDFDAKTTLAAETDGTIAFTTGETTYGVSFQSSNSALAGYPCRIVPYAEKATLLNYINSKIDPIEEANAREYISGTYLKQDGTEGAGLSQGTTGYIHFTSSDRAMLSGIVTGNTVYAYAFYDANKEYISGSSGGNNYSGNIQIPSTSVTIPQNAAYVRFSAKTNGENPVALVYNSQSVEAFSNGNAKNIHDINNVIRDIPVTVTKASARLTRYPVNGYLNNDTGAFVSHQNYQCYYFDAVSDCECYFDTQTTWGQIGIFNGTIFDPDDLVSIGSLGRSTLPYIDSKMSIPQGATVVICINIGNDFTFHYSEYALTQPQIDAIIKPHIKIVPVSSTQFLVRVLDELTGKYLDHSFIRTVYTDTLEYGSGQTKSVVTSDIWYSDNIYDSTGNAIMQGNTNFIQSVDIEGHTGHVGAGHGGVVADWSLFFADGERFDPTSMTDEIECSSFRFMTKAKHYLRDTANSPSSGHSYPTLDENGDPIVVSIQYYDGEWVVNNRIKARNRLDIVYSTSFEFKQAHAAMCCGFYPYFDNVIINNNEYLWNKFTKTGTNPDAFSATNMGGTDTVLPCPATSKLDGGDTVILFGDDYRLMTKIFNLNPTQYGGDNTMIQTPPYSDNRIKGYLMPCVCTDSNATLKNTHGVDTFVAGDRLDIMVWREIDIT